ncbi:tetratricopeptide repeat protein [Bacillus wiedmannii]|uniref:tetratricopeptide repeat protein n=1 Tax=Bacillus wiedmannii TaxID=1890302 RepID=UPI0020CB6D6A|nr:tetratricopeptide repeat protein [Bacillus wiedmannii]MCP9277752.1 tetratricopeptide repeat protein [Bacillus wiedmannii]
MAELAVKNVVELKKQLESLISEYIKELNLIVSTHVEIYDTDTGESHGLDPRVQELVKNQPTLFDFLGDDKEIEKNIDSINRMLNEEFIDEKQDEESVDEESLLNYFNFLNKGKYLCFIRFSGFERSVVSLFKENAHPFIKETLKYSFVRFIMHKMFEGLRNEKYTQLKENNRGDYIASKGREYMRELLNDVSAAPRTIKGVYHNDLFDEFNYISTLNYEGGTVSAKLLMISKTEIDKHINFYIRLEEPISFNQHRRIRKLLETSDKRTFLIGDHENIYGLGTLRDYEFLKDKTIFVIDFIGKFEYKISMISMSRNVITNVENGNVENVKWFLNEHPILFIRYGTPNLKENEFSDIKLKNKLKRIFGNKIEEKTKEKLVGIVKCAVKQKSGTTVVLTTSDVAEIEIEKLEREAIRINKTNLLNKSKSELRNIIERITCIDGAVYFDIKGNCYAIGVILDGITKKNQGDSSRGARYNSAVRYANKEGLQDNCVIIVISEDGMVDIIPDFEEMEEKINSLVNQLMELINKKQFGQALELIQQIQMANKTAKIYFFEGYIYEKMDNNDPERAIEMYNKAIELDGSYLSVYINRGRLNRRQGKYKDAVLDYTRVIELDGNKAIFYYHRAYAYIQLEKYEEAIEDCNKAIELDGNKASFYNRRGNIYAHLGKYEEAIEDCSKAIELDGNKAVFYGNRAFIYSHLGKYEEAIEDCNKAVGLNGDNAMRIYVYNQSGKYEEAIEDGNKAIELDGNNPIVYSNRGYAYIQLEKYEEAIEDCNKAIELDGNKASFYNNRGYAYNQLGKYEEAIEDCSKAIELVESKINVHSKRIKGNAYSNRSYAYNQLERYEEAVEDCNKAIELNPDKIEVVYYNRGYAFEKLKDDSKAEKDYIKAIEINPVYEEALEARDNLLSITKR